MDGQSAGAARAARELVEKVTGHPAESVTCPWSAFSDPDVREVIAAHEFWPAVEFWAGDDPEWWLIEGLRVYHRALEATRVDVALLKKGT